MAYQHIYINICIEWHSNVLPSNDQKLILLPIPKTPSKSLVHNVSFVFIQSLKIFDFYGHKFIEESSESVSTSFSFRCGIRNNLLK